MSTENQQPNNQDLKNSVLERLSREDMKPKAKMWFQCRECMTWVLWGASVLFGALAVAVVAMVMTHSRYAYFEATHNSPFEFVVEALPYIWFVVFVAMAVLAYVNLRQTKRGYKYPFTHIIASSLIFSLAGGALLHLVGVGSVVDRELGKRMPMYMSQEKKEVMMWQNPNEGRLVGNITSKDEEANEVTFVDVDGFDWSLEVMELRNIDRRQLFSGEQVRVLGVMTTSTPATMHACGVFPWIFNKKMPVAELEEGREGFVNRMYAHKDAADRLTELDKEARRDRKMGICAEMATVRRIGESMQ